MAKQIELVQFPKVEHVRAFVNEIKYRTSHLHKEFEIALVLKGEGEITINNKKYACKQNDIFFIASHDIHSYNASISGRAKGEEIVPPTYLIFQISNHFLLNYFPQIRTTVFESGKINDLLPENIRDQATVFLCETAKLYLKQEQYYQMLLVSNLARVFSYLYKYLDYEVLSEIEKQKTKRKNDRLQRIISYIELNYSNHIRLEEIAAEEDLSVTHFSHMFSAYFGVTFQEYINLKRLENSIRLMKDTQKSLLEISYESGFSDPKYMSKMFMKKFNCTPKQYRKNHMEDNSYSDNSAPMFPSEDGEEIYSSERALECINEFENIAK